MDKLNISRSGDKLTREDVIEKIKEYLKKLKNKDNLESVRADFVKEFKEVDASEIMLAEQRLLKEGTPLEEVQKLCTFCIIPWKNYRRKNFKCRKSCKSVC